LTNGRALAMLSLRRTAMGATGDGQRDGERQRDRPGDTDKASSERPPVDPQWPVRIRGLRKSFGDNPVLRGVNLDIERAKINVIIGGSGQGKTVLIKHIMSLVKPDEGHIWVDGEDIVPMGEGALTRVRRKLGMLFQYAALFDSMTVSENIAFPLSERYRMSHKEIDERVQDLLRRLDLQGTESRFPAELSGGMRKRVGLARALIDRPEILLYDEPTTGLDPVATDNVDQMIRHASAEFGVTSVVISHDMASVFRIGDRIAMLHDGRIRVMGTPEEILASADPVLRKFLATAVLPLPGAPRPVP
jgi:phospholipid/cholesterol/gamma-HCH transport system ATP-binding protein